MAFLRRIYRIAAIAVWTFALILMSVPYRFRGWQGRKKISYLLRLWAKGMAKIVNLKIHTYGDAHGATGGLVVSNHLSYIDIIAHGTVFPPRFTSTTEIAKWPVIGPVVDFSNPVVVDRNSPASSRKAFRDFAKTMKRGMYLIVYPEGTSTDGKNGILPFKSTSFEAATAGDMPVIPILTRYREAPGRTTVCWYGDMTFLPHVWEVLGYPSIDSELHFMPPIYPEGRSRKKMSSYVHELMNCEYQKLAKA
ncbi:MAG: lysophospholipid acyltransferase family protein [Candidatus Omnitrophota bacterium]|jgi:1-acyl-sn-glycerol-3-phosphate acyltransferase